MRDYHEFGRLPLLIVGVLCATIGVCGGIVLTRATNTDAQMLAALKEKTATREEEIKSIIARAENLVAETYIRHGLQNNILVLWEKEVPSVAAVIAADVAGRALRPVYLDQRLFNTGIRRIEILPNFKP